VLVLLDSTVLIDYLCGQPAVDRIRQLLTGGDTVATSAVNVEELVRGMRPSETDVVDALLEGLVVIPVDEAVARLSGRWRAAHAKRGITVHQADCLVAATASVHGALLCTGNPKDFPMLDVEHWPVGE
jgi:predicted nucleic acid-binding protein